MEDKIKIDIKKGGGSIEASGESAVALSNLISPFTSFGKVIGERINIWGDLWNLEYTARAVARAREIASESNLVIEYKPTKFLKEWALKSSLEEDEDMIEKWAHLLLSASVDYDSRDSIHTSLLSNLGTEEANILSKIWEASSKKRSLEFLQRAGGSAFDISFWEILKGESIPKEHLPFESLSDEDVDLLGTKIFNELIATGLYPETVGVYSNDKRLTWHAWSPDHPGIEMEPYLIESLVHLGLLKRGHISFELGSRFNGARLSFNAYVLGLSNIGFCFMSAVSPK
ncbi:hypothetical protein NBRC116583_02450 [Arenicella sp. 4NH20-0111]|uniref:hypothetical protein n=1 Tax=Arenicella sp. 4NH20-0111 TaxID=3127648 RepID=UPI0031097D86